MTFRFLFFLYLPYPPTIIKVNEETSVLLENYCSLNFNMLPLIKILFFFSLLTSPFLLVYASQETCIEILFTEGWCDAFESYEILIN